MEMARAGAPGQLAFAPDDEAALPARLQGLRQTVTEIEPDHARAGSNLCFDASTGTSVG